jgi:hypothetical protein
MGYTSGLVSILLTQKAGAPQPQLQWEFVKMQME